MGRIHEHMLTMLRPPLSPIKHAIMERMCKVADDQGLVRLTAKEVLKPIKQFDENTKYQFWVELVRDQKMIINVLATDTTVNKFFRDVGSKVYYQVAFPSITSTPNTYVSILRFRVRNAQSMFKDILQITSSDPALTHKTAEELLAECAVVAKRGFEQSNYRKDEIIKYLEILGNGGEIPRPMECNQEDTDGRTGDAPGVREDVKEGAST